MEGTFELGLGGEAWEEDILVEPGQGHEIPDLVSSSICPVRLILNLKGGKVKLIIIGFSILLLSYFRLEKGTDVILD